MPTVIALSGFMYQGKRVAGDVFDVASQVHTKQLLQKGLVELYSASAQAEPKKKEPTQSLPAAPASPAPMSPSSDDGDPPKKRQAKTKSAG